MAEEHEFVCRMDSYTRVNDGVIFHCVTNRGKSVDVELTVCTPRILRFRMCADEKLKDIDGLLEIREDWHPCPFEIVEKVVETASLKSTGRLVEKTDTVSIDTGALRLEAHKNPWKYVIYSLSGEVVLQEENQDLDCHASYRSMPLGFTVKDGEACRSNETFYLNPGENFYGFGEKFTRFNKIGQTIRRWWNVDALGSGTEDAYKHIPFFMSTRGYGIFINTTYPITCHLGSRSQKTFTIIVDDPRLDLFIIYGPSLKDVLAGYVEVTGLPSLPPKESFGIWHTPTTSSDPVAIGRKFRDLDIPVDYFMCVQFWTTPDEVKELSEKLGRIGIKTGMYVRPMLAVGTPMEIEARKHGYAIVQEDGSPYEAFVSLAPISQSEREARLEKWRAEGYSLSMINRDDAWKDAHNRIFNIPGLMVDFTNPDAVKWWKGKIIEKMKAGCFGIAMSDFGEEVPTDACFHNKRSALEMHNVYQNLYQKAAYEAVVEGTGHRGLINARSGTSGMQRYPICWSGDVDCSWEAMVISLRAGLSVGLCGVPFWANDNSGYQSETGRITPELWIRWSQMSMFQSHVRLHGRPPLRVPWTFGERAVENFRRYAKLRYRLIPYIYSHAYNATKTGLPMMRAMVLEFQDDPNTYDIEDQYIFGREFLVAPVYSSTDKRTVYLPEGKWFDYWTSQEYEGPTRLRIKPPLEVLPLYVRADSIIPIGPDMAYVGEKPFNPITLDIWLCSEAEFTIYDDDETVRCRAKREDSRINLELDASKKTYIAKFNRTDCPTSVHLNDIEVPRLTSHTELDETELGWYFDPSLVVYVKFNALDSSRLILQV